MEFPTTVVTTPPCIMCGQQGTVTVLTADLERRRAGAHVQVAYPEMPDELREQVINGTHPPCQTAMGY